MLRFIHGNQGITQLDRIFDFSPSVELLQVLARGSLKQNLAKAVRLWVILRSLYGDTTDPIYAELEECFIYNDWRKQFFTETHQYHNNDKISPLHDVNCPCSQTLSDWLFDPETGVNQQQWQDSFLNFYLMSDLELKHLLGFGIIDPPKYQINGSEIRLFAGTRRNLQYDFKALVEMGWLEGQNDTEPGKNRGKTFYKKVKKFPDLGTFSERVDFPLEMGGVRNVIQNDLVDFLDDFAETINGEQRFFVDLEYVVHRQLAPQINHLRQQLKEIWQQVPIPPIQVSYVSARNYQNYQDDGEIYIIYPVCIYYSYRAPYLLGFGQTPRDETKIDWYDYRLDRIKDLQVLTWQQVNLPNFNREICQSKTPKTIEDLRSQAWGFDFYKPDDLLLVRFDRYFHNRYIEGTERDELFKKIPYKYAQGLISQSHLNDSEKQRLIMVLNSRSPDDVYCRVNYRVDDYNVIMRLRAWGPKVEVLLPWNLRKTMAEDIQKLGSFYKD
ncbi:conserved hypothetical protein [Planktothrix sp. PCC 11201]|uniref:TIGR03985 family CRISPR-associated protein n=1 Tax=Planktothrix sp. PCC 11201 TaxID=1729650 RepID=UPI00091C122C|nr:TIGR03985 family CRISPR-associated protein [Planktothrix sp. PCC 11201]SKB13815.1 conserved hypothetical protein [Planktothrix sp. PCC 11201]